MRPFFVTASVLAVFAVWCAVAPAAILVSEDVSVMGQGQSSFNAFSNTYRGGLFSGVDGLAGSDNPARFYLKFNLPAYAPNTAVTSAILSGYYNDDWNAADDRTHHFYQAANDTWSATTITWNNQPGAIGGPLALFNASATSPGTWQSWDITGIVNQEYQGDGILSLMFRADDESLVSTNNNWEYFARSAYDPNLAFRIDLVTGPSSGDVPEPTTLLIWSGLGVLGLFAAWRRPKQGN